MPTIKVDSKGRITLPLKVRQELGVEPGATFFYERVGATLRLARTENPFLTVIRDPEICGGAPTLAGTRIAVHDVVSYLRLYDGDPQRVREEALPHLSPEQIRTALDWYHEHREEIDDLLHQRQEYNDRLRERAPASR